MISKNKWEETIMKLTKRIITCLVVVALAIASLPMGVMAVTKDDTNKIPNRAKLMKLVDEFSLPVGVLEEYEMNPGTNRNYNFSKAKARRAILKYRTESKKKMNKYSKRMFGVKTSKVTPFPGEWGNSNIVMEVDNIKKTSARQYFVNGRVYMSTYNDHKKHKCGTFKMLVQKNSKAKYKYVAKTLKLSTWPTAKTKSSTVNLFASAKKYKKITASMTYQRITVSGVKGSKKINTVLKNDYDRFLKNPKRNSFYEWVAEDNANPKKKKNHYYYNTSSTVKYNMNNILSIRITIKFYAGTVVNIDKYGYNFNAKTGNKITIRNVCRGSDQSIKNRMYKAINKQKWAKKYKKKAKKIIKKTSLTNLEFYMKNDKAIVCFKPYTLGGKQRQLRTFYIKSKYF